MTKRLLIINVVYAVVDTLIFAIGICGFTLCALHFGKWWLVLFNLLPLSLFSRHSLIIDNDLVLASQADEEEVVGKTDG